MSLLQILIVIAYQFITCHGFKTYFTAYKSTLKLKSVSVSTIVPPSNTLIIQDNEAQNILQNLKCVNVKISSSISTISMIPTSFAKFEPLQNIKAQSIPIVLIHGFDSSCLEFRRLAPLLSENSEVYGTMYVILYCIFTTLHLTTHTTTIINYYYYY